MSGTVIPLFRPVVVTKDGTTYELEPDQTGTPAAELFGAASAERLGISRMTVHDIPDGRRIVARPDNSATTRISPSQTRIEGELPF